MLGIARMQSGMSDKRSRVLRDSRRTDLRYSQALVAQENQASKSCLRPKKKRTPADTPAPRSQEPTAMPTRTPPNGLAGSSLSPAPAARRRQQTVDNGGEARHSRLTAD